MAVYPKLLLSAGGGIISLQQQAVQEPGSASVLIGLGGTGVECLRTIKTQVYSRLRPDDPDAIVPTYQHIRFLGVDTDAKSCGIMGSKEERADALLPLDDTEFFSIANAHVKRDLSNKLSLRDRKELDWLCHEEIKAGDLTIAGAGGIRQVGRYMLMDKSNLFLSRLQQEITLAKTNVTNPKVNIHIFSGISGGTGAGTFLDVCYMAKHVARKLGGATVFGYFFLPDVNLSRIPYESTNVRAYIPRNGYASMQELDYCMSIQTNGGSFTQIYQGGQRIDWDEAPVDLCHLVCATNSNGDVVENAYDYAMNVTAEYVMDFLTQADSNYDLTSQLSNMTSHVSEADQKKPYGMNMGYCVIGASCASLPLREVNTYVAAELFDRFSTVSNNLPVKADIEQFAVSALGRSSQLSIADLYDRLYDELMEGVEMSFNRFDDWEYARYNTEEVRKHYASQTSAKKGRVQTNAKSMGDPENEESLINRIRQQLTTVIRDIHQGPICAHRMLSAAESHNFLNIIDGLIEQNQHNYEAEDAQGDRLKEDAQRAENDVLNRRKRKLLDNDQKRVEDYEYYLSLLEQNNLALESYASLDAVFRELREQVEAADASYYRRLARVVSNLIDTFHENRDALASDRVQISNNTFAMPLMTISELRGPLDRQLGKVDVSGLLSQFMGMLLNHPDDWNKDDENKICKLVTKFFVEEAFGEVAGRSITQFLKDKYDTDSDEDLAEKMYKDWMLRLTEMARPLFYFNGTLWREDDNDPYAYISVPSTSTPLKTAAQKMKNNNSRWNVKESGLTDRIYVMSTAAALPLASYNNCEEYERSYFSSSGVRGAHYYEGKPIEDMYFDDWRKLPPLTPQSVIRMDSTTPEQVRNMVVEVRELYARACDENLFKGGVDNYIMRPSSEWLQELREAAAACQEKAASMSKPDEQSEAEEFLARLDEACEVRLEETPWKLEHKGRAENEAERQRLCLDYFTYSPPLQMRVREIIDTIDAARAEAEQAKQALQETIERVGSGSQDADNFCEALFTGVIALEGRIVTYRKQGQFDTEEIVLSKRGPEFPFGSIPPYQGFLNFCALSPEDRAEMRAETDRRLNEATDEEIAAVVKKLQGELSNERFRVWSNAAAKFPARAEIVDFLKSLSTQFADYCAENVF